MTAKLTCHTEPELTPPQGPGTAQLSPAHTGQSPPAAVLRPWAGSALQEKEIPVGQQGDRATKLQHTHFNIKGGSENQSKGTQGIYNSSLNFQLSFSSLFLV